MAWSPSRSSGSGPDGSALLPDLSPPTLRNMVPLSGAFHVLLAVLAFSVSALRGPALRLEPVAVVDLVGGGEFREVASREPVPPSAPAKKEKATPASRRGKREKAPARGKAARTAAKTPALATAPDGYASPAKKDPDLSSVEERLRQMREARAESESVRRAIDSRRREEAARAAVRGVGERVAHRIESPALAKAAPGGGMAGAQGTVRLPPELQEYFRRLEEAVRRAWLLPESVAREAGKLVVELRIVIEKDGHVSDSRIERSSGNAYFDESVRRAIRKASPLPVPPERLRGVEEYYEVGFRFHGSGGAA